MNTINNYQNISRNFVTINNNRQIHYRRAGKGPPILLLHQSPKSSKELIPVIDGLKKNFNKSTQNNNLKRFQYNENIINKARLSLKKDKGILINE